MPWLMPPRERPSGAVETPRASSQCGQSPGRPHPQREIARPLLSYGQRTEPWTALDGQIRSQSQF